MGFKSDTPGVSDLRRHLTALARGVRRHRCEAAQRPTAAESGFAADLPM